ncbi:hypothetical protein H2Y56_18790 [Pectobacterium aroidearum]|uniref:Uncharacterized protein n=1 Tax=Pectobacterium aroidearum TaxID=1201031 RepID=A0ABR5ZHT2_9GAMM|nr:hypothetical protein [Pectobacterium aroidearum]MBA5201361.1 hypothetical protein [Pectobacterium aroidearum]MBA5234141.1 hypothetical protein [Pectobacterium aroidearum]MBA5739333.1 hypothetical protein [Pectobacterium aroidearum]
MSTQLSLVDYPRNDVGEVYEPENSVVASVFISNEIIDNFDRLGLFEKFHLYEDSSLSEFVVQTRIKQDMIDDALREIESTFIRLLDSEKVAEIKKIQTDESIGSLIGEFNVITNIHHLLNLKKNNFSSIDSAIIKLG